ncbi:MAG: zinc-ribbon and DUF3426 domain-containing protein [Corticimicrobacter sp.]|uniref:zinc-ribbon and DUF3426 domain-containing protein n=1 Tax=Corticimicrobacter sp. TaxID=2678536 RepID=UPI0032D9DE25
MGLQTRCPACHTVFGITPDLLARRHGMVRCGACLTVFDGRQSLSDTDDLPLLTEAVSSSEATSSSLADSPALPVEEEGAPRHWLGDPPAAGIEDEDEREHETTGYAAPARDPEFDAPADTFLLDETDRRAGLPEFLDDDTQDRRRRHQGFWTLLCVLALAVMLLQLFWQQRDWIASWHPAVRGVIERVCDPLGCKVGYLRHPDQLQIVSSSLQTATPTTDGSSQLTLPGERHSLDLTLRLRNGHHSPQPWPGIFLSLTDFSDTIVARKALLPADYLPPDRLSRPFAAMSSLDLSIPLTLDDLTVSGYRLELFFP